MELLARKKLYVIAAQLLPVKITILVQTIFVTQDLDANSQQRTVMIEVLVPRIPVFDRMEVVFMRKLHSHV